MSHETNKELVRRAVEDVFNTGNLVAVEQLYAADYTHHDPGTPDVRNRTELQHWAAGLREAFPDLHITVDALVTEGDLVAKRWHCTGTQTGTFAGIPPTGRSVNFSGTTTYRIANGKIAETWWNTDLMTLMQQLGVIPGSQAAEVGL